MEDINFFFVSNIDNIFNIVLVILVIIARYLVLNKIWLRKHEPEVADSVSIVAVIIEVLIVIPYIILSVYDLSVKSFILQLIALMSGVFVFFIGVGFWIKNGLNFKDKLARTFKVEQKEYKSMIKEVFHTRDMNKIFSFICMFAIVDQELHENEELLLKRFANNYNLNYNLTMSDVKNRFSRDGHSSPAVIMKEIRNSIKKFLETAPPKQVVIYLEDIIMHLVKVDKLITKEEKIISNEIRAMLQQYLLGEKVDGFLYYIVVVPQTKEQEDAIFALNIRYKKTKATVAGTQNAYLVDSYHSQEFAEVIRDKYITLFNCFVTVERLPVQ